MHPQLHSSASQLSNPLEVTWASSISPLLTIYEAGSPEQRIVARRDLQRMAEVADLAFNVVKTIERMVIEQPARDNNDVPQVFLEAEHLNNGLRSDLSLDRIGDSSPTAEVSLMCGVLAKRRSQLDLPLDVCYGVCGYYIGTFCDAQPFTRESEEHWSRRELAATALKNGDWTQRIEHQ